MGRAAADIADSHEEDDEIPDLVLWLLFPSWLNRAHAVISCNIPPDDATRCAHITTLNALYARAIELARAERLAASRARTACAHAAATIMPVHTVAQKSPVAYTPAADEPAAS